MGVPFIPERASPTNERVLNSTSNLSILWKKKFFLKPSQH